MRVLRKRCEPQIGNSVVVTDAIDVVNRLIRPSSIVESPSYFVTKDVMTANNNHPITARIHSPRKATGPRPSAIN
jgi:hypothetical protein